jgi:site-specific DNA-methyltransferase (adenine-specific)
VAYNINHANIKDWAANYDGEPFDAILCDPPYELGFMGKSWDSSGIAFDTEMWADLFRILKPGGHLLAFSGSRTYHRMAVAIEDAGFEIRDMIEWVYGSGFPKSLNIGKVADKYLKTGNASWNGTGDSSNGALGYSKLQHKQGYRPNDYSNKHQTKSEITEEQAKLWEGYGTALKPAHEPCVLARKPIEGTVANNVLKHGTGGLNIDGTRVAGDMGADRALGKPRIDTDKYGKANSTLNPQSPLGRFPANLIHDGSDEVERLFPQSNAGNYGAKTYEKAGGHWGQGKQIRNADFGDSGSASRFFYTAKPDEPNGRTLIECGFCSKPQEIRLSKKRTHNYCSLDCARKGRTKFNSQEVECAFCGSNFTKKNSQLFTDKHFCSRTCMGDWQAKFYVGEEAHNYKGGVTALNKRIRSLAKMTEWRIDVFKRDSYTCQVCGDNAGGNLNAHHKKMLANMIADLNITDLTMAIECEELWDRDNGITLCVECHQDEHNKYAMSRFVYTAKASKSERNQGLEGFEEQITNDGRKTDIDNAFQRGITERKNHHPTVKPLSLTKYLATLIKPPTGGRLLVPFSGSGSEMIGALQAGWEYVEGVELTEEYIPIAKARIEYWLDKMSKEQLGLL